MTGRSTFRGNVRENPGQPRRAIGARGLCRAPGEFFLPSLPSLDAEAIQALSRLHAFAPGCDLITPATAPGELLIVADGFVKVARRGGTREVVLSVHGPGEVLGEEALFDGRGHSAFVTSLTAGAAVLLPVEAFWSVLRARPYLYRAIMATISSRLRDAGDHRAEQLAAPAIVRLAGRILWLADRFSYQSDEATVIDVPLTQAELSSWAGVSRESGVRALRQLRDVGWIDIRRRRFVVQDRCELERFVMAGIAVQGLPLR